MRCDASSHDQFSWVIHCQACWVAWYLIPGNRYLIPDIWYLILDAVYLMLFSLLESEPWLPELGRRLRCELETRLQGCFSASCFPSRVEYPCHTNSRSLQGLSTPVRYISVRFMVLSTVVRYRCQEASSRWTWLQLPVTIDNMWLCLVLIFSEQWVLWCSSSVISGTLGSHLGLWHTYLIHYQICSSSGSSNTCWIAVVLHHRHACWCFST